MDYNVFTPAVSTQAFPHKTEIARAEKPVTLLPRTRKYLNAGDASDAEILAFYRAKNPEYTKSSDDELAGFLEEKNLEANFAQRTVKSAGKVTIDRLGNLFDMGHAPVGEQEQRNISALEQLIPQKEYQYRPSNDPFKVPEAKQFSDHVADFLGYVIADTPLIMATGGTGGAASAKLGLEGIKGLAAREAIAGALFAQTHKYDNERERLIGTLEEAALWTGMGVGGHYLGKGLKRLAGKLRKGGKAPLTAKEQGEIKELVEDWRNKIEEVSPEEAAKYSWNGPDPFTSGEREILDRAAPEINARMNDPHWKARQEYEANRPKGFIPEETEETARIREGQKWQSGPIPENNVGPDFSPHLEYNHMQLSGNMQKLLPGRAGPRAEYTPPPLVPEPGHGARPGEQVLGRNPGKLTATQFKARQEGIPIFNSNGKPYTDAFLKARMRGIPSKAGAGIYEMSADGGRGLYELQQQAKDLNIPIRNPKGKPYSAKYLKARIKGKEQIEEVARRSRLERGEKPFTETENQAPTQGDGLNITITPETVEKLKKARDGLRAASESLEKIKNPKPTQVKKQSLAERSPKVRKTLEKCKEKTGWKMTKEEFSGTAAEHEQIVQSAYLRGEKLPDNVLEQYPQYKRKVKPSSYKKKVNKAIPPEKVEKRLVDMRDTINEGIKLNRKDDIEYLRKAELFASEHGYELTFDRQKRRAILTKDGKPIKAQAVRVTDKVDDPVLMDDIPQDKRELIQNIVRESGSTLDIEGLSRSQIEAAVKDIQHDAGKEATIRAQETINQVLKGIDEGGIPVKHPGGRNLRAEHEEIPIEYFQKKASEKSSKGGLEPAAHTTEHAPVTEPMPEIEAQYSRADVDDLERLSPKVKKAIEKYGRKTADVKGETKKNISKWKQAQDEAQQAIDDIGDTWSASGPSLDEMRGAIQKVAKKYNVPYNTLRKKVLWEPEIKPEKHNIPKGLKAWEQKQQERLDELNIKNVKPKSPKVEKAIDKANSKKKPREQLDLIKVQAEIPRGKIGKTSEAIEGREGVGMFKTEPKAVDQTDAFKKNKVKEAVVSWNGETASLDMLYPMLHDNIYRQRIKAHSATPFYEKAFELSIVDVIGKPTNYRTKIQYEKDRAVWRFYKKLGFESKLHNRSGDKVHYLTEPDNLKQARKLYKGAWAYENKIRKAVEHYFKTGERITNAGEIPRTGVQHSSGGNKAGNVVPLREKASKRGIESDVTKSNNFKKWFGDWETNPEKASKVLDDQGKPLVVYKAMPAYDSKTGKPLTEINRAKVSDFPAFHGDEPGVNIAGFFAEDPKIANRFSKLFKPAQPIYPVYLDIKQPKIFDAGGKYAGSMQFGESGKPFREAIRSGKYDGIIIKNTKDEGTVYVALKSTQIKSSIGNRGTFDSLDPNILHGKAWPAGAVFGIKKDDEGNLTFDPAMAVKGMASIAVGEAALKSVIKNYKNRYRTGIVSEGFTSGRSETANQPVGGHGVRREKKLPGEKGRFRSFLSKIEDAFEIPKSNLDKTNLKRYGSRTVKAETIETDARELKKVFQTKVNARLIKEGKGLKEREHEANIAASAAALIMDEPAYIHSPAWREDIREVRGLWKAHKMPQSAIEQLERTVKLAEKPTDDVLWLVNELQESYLQLGRYAEDEGLIKQMRDYYVTHIWDHKDIIGKGISDLTLKKSFKYGKERTIPTYIDGLKMGLNPVTLNAIELNKVYQKTMAGVVADRRFVKALEGLRIDDIDSMPMIVSQESFDRMKPMWKRRYTTVDHPAFKRYNKRTATDTGKPETIWEEKSMYVHADAARDIQKIFGSSKLREMLLPAKLMRINNYYKRAKLAASGFHHVALGINNTFLGGEKWYSLGNPTPWDIGSWKSVHKQGLKALREKDQVLNHLLDNGLTLRESGKAADYHRVVKDKFTKWVDIKDPNVANKVKSKIEKGVELWDDALWDRYYAGSKAAVAKVQYGKWLKTLKNRKTEYGEMYREWETLGFPTTGKSKYEKAAAQFAARDVNDLYGGLNTEVLKISKSTYDAIRLAILAPDWTISNWRYTINGARDMINPRGSVTAQETIKVMATLGALGYMVNHAATGHGPLENPEGTKTMIAVGKNENGKMMYVDLYRHFGEFLKVGKYGDKDKPLKYVYESPVRYAVNKSSQIVRMIDMVRTGKDWRDRPLASMEDLKQWKLSGSKYTPWWERGSSLPGVALMVLVESGIPIPVSTGIRAATGNEPGSIAALSVFGIHAKEEPEQYVRKTSSTGRRRRKRRSR